MTKHRTSEYEAVSNDNNRLPDYFLRARLTVPRDKFSEFVKAADRILPTFEDRTGFVLEVAAFAELEGGSIDVFHLWDISHPETLVDTMTFLGDFPAYLALDKLVTYADQDIVIALPRLGVVGRRGYSEGPDSEARRHARRHQSLVRPIARLVDSFKKNQLDEIMARYEERLPETEAKVKAELVGGFLNITGDLDQIHWIWRLNEKAGLGFDTGKLPDRDLVKVEAKPTIMKPAPYPAAGGRQAAVGA